MKKLVGLIAVIISLFIGNAFAQMDSHSVQVMMPQVMRLTIDATNVVFDFGDTTATGNHATTGEPLAGDANYSAFLIGNNATQLFAPTRLEGTANDYVNARIVTNYAGNVGLTVTGVGTFTSLPNAVHLSTDGGATYAPVVADLTTPVATGTGPGRSDISLYFAYEMDASVDYGVGANESIVINYRAISF